MRRDDDQPLGENGLTALLTRAGRQGAEDERPVLGLLVRTAPNSLVFVCSFGLGLAGTPQRRPASGARGARAAGLAETDASTTAASAPSRARHGRSTDPSRQQRKQTRSCDS